MKKQSNNANESVKKQKIKMLVIGGVIIVAIIVANIFIGIAGHNIEQGYLSSHNNVVTQIAKQ